MGGFKKNPINRLGKVAMIVLLIGLKAGIIGQGVYVVLVLTRIVYPNWFYKGE